MYTQVSGFAVLAALALGSPPVQAQDVPRTIVEFIHLSPERQTVQAAVWVDTGFPLGQVLTSVILDCGAGTPPAIYGLSEQGDGAMQADTAKTAAVRQLKQIQSSQTAVTFAHPSGDLRFSCQDKTLVTDFSKIAAKVDGALDAQSDIEFFNIQQASSIGMLLLKYPLASKSSQRGSISPETITLRFTGSSWKGNKILAGITAIDWEDEPQSSIFVYDVKKNTLYPVLYNGRSTTEQLKNYAIGERLDVYLAPDYSVPTGWRRLSIDFKAGTITNKPASKPPGAKFAP